MAECEVCGKPASTKPRYMGRWCQSCGDEPINADPHPDNQCSIEGCDSRIRSLGLCNKHYLEKRRRDRGIPPARQAAPAKPGQKVCSISGCPRRVKAWGYCGAHYRRLLSHGDVNVVKQGGIKSQRTCSVEGCDRPHFGKGYCQPHHWRQWKHGDVQADKPIGRYVCAVDGCQRRHSQHGYCAAHYARLVAYGDPLLVKQRAARWSKTPYRIIETGELVE